MKTNEIITFVILGTTDNNLANEIFMAEKILHYGNAIILREAEKFVMLLEGLNDDFQFRLIIHYGLRQEALRVGKILIQAINEQFNFPEYVFFTRENSIFSDENDRKWIKYEDKIIYNFDFMNMESFIDQLPIYTKRDVLKGKTIITKTEKPRVFIGSSVEGLEVARAIKSGLEHDAFVDVWNENIFKPGETNIETIERILDVYEYSIFVFRSDDKIYTRDNLKNVPRDNVILEYGMFLGKHTRRKTLFITPRGKNIGIATDLIGVVSLDYDEDNTNLISAVGTACNKIRDVIKPK